MDATWASRPYHKNKKRLPSFGTECSNPGESSSFSTSLISPYHKFKKLPVCPLSTRIPPLDKHYKYQLHGCSYEHAQASTSTFNHPFASEDEMAVYSKHVCIHIPISISPPPNFAPSNNGPETAPLKKKASFFPTPESHLSFYKSR
jgi:hypothetical protein